MAAFSVFFVLWGQNSICSLHINRTTGPSVLINIPTVASPNYLFLHFNWDEARICQERLTMTSTVPQAYWPQYQTSGEALVLFCGRRAILLVMLSKPGWHGKLHYPASSGAFVFGHFKRCVLLTPLGSCPLVNQNDGERCAADRNRPPCLLKLRQVHDEWQAVMQSTLMWSKMDV